MPHQSILQAVFLLAFVQLQYANAARIFYTGNVSLGTLENVLFNGKVFDLVKYDEIVLVVDENALWRFDPETLNKELIAGSTERGYVEGVGGDARFKGIRAVTVTNANLVTVSDGENNCLREIDLISNQTRSLTGLCGSEGGLVDGSPDVARFYLPGGLFWHSSFGTFIADSGNNALRLLDQYGELTTLHNGSTIKGPGYFALMDEKLYFPVQGGGVMVYDLYNGSLDVLTGDVNSPGYEDGSLAAARFSAPIGIASPSPGVLLVVELLHRIRVIDLIKEQVSTICTGRLGNTEGNATTCKIAFPQSIMVLSDDIAYISSQASGKMRTLSLHSFTVNTTNSTTTTETSKITTTPIPITTTKTTSTTEQPTSTTTEQPTSTTTELPTTSTTELPTTSTTEQATTSATKQPTSTTTEQPATTTTEHPATTTTEQPTSTTTEQPTSTTTELPTTSTTEQATTSTTEHPATTTTEQPRTATTEQPTTTTTEQPVTATTEHPATTATEQPTTIITKEPSSTTTEQLTTSTTELATTSTTEQRATTTTKQLPPTTSEQATTTTAEPTLSTAIAITLPIIGISLNESTAATTTTITANIPLTTTTIQGTGTPQTRKQNKDSSSQHPCFGSTGWTNIIYPSELAFECIVFISVGIFGVLVLSVIAVALVAIIVKGHRHQRRLVQQNGFTRLEVIPT